MTHVRGGDSPSAWPHRLPVLVLALAGAVLSTYLTLYQWHVTGTVWDPRCGAASSERVLTSAVSRALPVPDATLGAVAYLVEAVLVVLGDERRSERAPWIVALYGLALVALAATGCVLILVQVLVVHALCTLCVGSAAISIVNLLLGLPEVAAAIPRLGVGGRSGTHRG